MSNEMIVAEEPRGMTVFDQNAGDFRGALARRGDNRKTLIAWVREALVEGVDFGRIHMVKKDKCALGSKCKNDNHFSKPTLFKPGSEKICGMLGVTPTFPRLRDYEQMVIDGREILHIIIGCQIVGVDRAVVSEGVGARSLITDNGDINKALKMACKSAAIDATLRMAGLSEIFTQDIGDPKSSAQANDDPQSDEPETERSVDKTSKTTGGTAALATAKQLKLIRVKLDQAEISAEECCEQFSLESLAQCPFTAVNDVLAWISKHGDAQGPSR